MKDEVSFLDDVPRETVLEQISRHHVTLEDLERLLCLKTAEKHC